MPLILLAAAGVFVTTATVVGVVIARQNQGDNPGGFSLLVIETSATRDVNDLPVVSIRYRVDLQSDAAGAALQSALKVQCVIKQGQKTRTRSFSGEREAFESRRFIDGSIEIAPGEDNKSIQGPYSVDCELRRDGALLDSASGEDVIVPKPSGKQMVDVTDLAGVYRVALTRTAGSTVDCVLDGTRTVNVVATTATSAKVSWEALVLYTGPLDESLAFTGDVAINPGFTDYFGPFEAHFDRSTAPTSLTGTIQTTDPACSFSFLGSRADA